MESNEEVEKLKKRVAELEAALQSDASDLWKVTNAIKEELNARSWMLSGSRKDELEELYTAIQNHISFAQNPAQKRFYSVLTNNPFITAHKAYVNKLTEAYDKYTKLLGDEVDELSSVANVHGWKSTRFEQGVECRKQIELVKKEMIY